MLCDWNKRDDCVCSSFSEYARDCYVAQEGFEDEVPWRSANLCGKGFELIKVLRKFL